MWGYCCAGPPADEGAVTEFFTTDEVLGRGALTPHLQVLSPAPAEVLGREALAPHLQLLSPAPAEAPRRREPAPARGSTLLGHPMNLAAGGGKAESPAAGKGRPDEAEAPRSEAGTPVPSAHGRMEEASPFAGAQDHKEHLQDLVTEFVRKAMKGCRCVYLAERVSGEVEKVNAEYFVDTGLVWLTVAPEAAGLILCPLEAVQDIVHVEKDGRACFGPWITAALEPHEAELLLMVVPSGAQQLRSNIHLLMSSHEERDMFLECLQILSIYAKSQDAEC